MSGIHRLSAALFGVAAPLLAAELALAQASVDPDQLGVVQAPIRGSIGLTLNRVPVVVRHSALVAAKEYDSKASLASAQIDLDEVLAIWEIAGKTGDGRDLEVDVRPDGTVAELEVEVRRNELPQAVAQALERFAPKLAAESGAKIEKSIRPSDIGLSEIWYEFSGSEFDVEVRSDGRAVLIEPA